MNLFNLLLNNYTKNPDSIALQDDKRKITYKEYFKLVIQIADRLQEKYDLKNRKVIVLLHNSIEYVLYIQALHLLDKTVIPLSSISSKLEIEYIASEIDPDLIVCDTANEKNLPENYKGHIERINIDLFSIQDESSESNIDEIGNKIRNLQNDDAFILYTSGSTGKLKGIICTHDAIVFAVRSISKSLGIEESDSIFCALPFSFDYGLYQVYISHVAKSCIYILKEGMNPLLLQYEIYKSQATILPVVPMWLNVLHYTNKLSAERLCKVRTITSTGDVLSQKVINYTVEKLPTVNIYPMYGLTECKRVSILSHSDIHRKLGSVGKPLDGTYVRLVNDDGSNADDIGELVVSGPHLMKGYYNDSCLTNRTYVYNKKDKRKELFTGDIFRIDDEGYLYFVSRKQNYIKRNGLRIGPGLIDDILIKHSDMIEYSLTVINRFDSQEELITFIRPNEDYESNELKREIFDLLPKTYYPNQVFIIGDNIPYTTRGKVDRRALLVLTKGGEKLI